MGIAAGGVLRYDTIRYGKGVLQYVSQYIRHSLHGHMTQLMGGPTTVFDLFVAFKSSINFPPFQQTH